MMIISSGAMWSEPVKEGAAGATTRACSWSTPSARRRRSAWACPCRPAGPAAKTASFTLGPDVKVLTDDGRQVEPGSEEIGVLALGGRNPLGYYKDEEKSDRTFKEIDGVRYSIPGDFAQVDADGTIHLLGRGSVCINSGGEKIFPEEVEEALKTHDVVRDAVVVGIPHPTYGEQIVAVIEPAGRARRAGGGGPDRARQGAPGVVQGAAAGAVRGHVSGARPTARWTTSGTGPSRWRSWGRRRRVSASARLAGPTDVRRPGRRHPRRTGVARLRGGPSLRAPGRRRRARATGSRWWCRRSSCWPVRRCGCILCGRTRSSPCAGRESRAVVLSVAGDWAFIPSAWKAIDGEDPALGIPTTYYGAVQLEGEAYVHDERTAPGTVAPSCAVSSASFQPDVDGGRPGRGARGEAARASSGSRSGWSGSARSSSTAGTSTPAHRRAVVERLWPGAHPTTGRRPDTRCAASNREAGLEARALAGRLGRR